MISARNIIKNSKKGFTLIELLVVIGILAVLLSIVLIAINPARQFGQANDTKRRSDIQAVLNAIGAYAADNHGTLPGTIPVAPAAAADVSSVTGLCHALLGSADTGNANGASYISAIPTDPGLNIAAITDCTSPAATGYTVQQDSAGRVTVSATGQIDNPLSVTR